MFNGVEFVCIKLSQFALKKEVREARVVDVFRAVFTSSLISGDSALNKTATVLCSSLVCEHPLLILMLVLSSAHSYFTSMNQALTQPASSYFHRPLSDFLPVILL